MNNCKECGANCDGELCAFCKEAIDSYENELTRLKKKYERACKKGKDDYETRLETRKMLLAKGIDFGVEYTLDTSFFKRVTINPDTRFTVTGISACSIIVTSTKHTITAEISHKDLGIMKKVDDIS